MSAANARARTTTLNIRGIDAAVAREIKRGASARGLTIAQYLHRLAMLHVAVRELDSREARQVLETLGLQTVTA